MEPPLLPSPLGLVTALSGPAVAAPVRRQALPGWADTLTFFRPGARYRGPWDDEGAPPPDDTPAIPPLPFADDRSPLTDRERAVWGVFAALLAFTLFAFVAVVVFAHTPMNAN